MLTKEAFAPLSVTCAPEEGLPAEPISELLANVPESPPVNVVVAAVTRKPSLVLLRKVADSPAKLAVAVFAPTVPDSRTPLVEPIPEIAVPVTLFAA